MPRPSESRTLSQLLLGVFNQSNKMVQPLRDDREWRLEKCSVAELTVYAIELRKLKKRCRL